MPLYEYACEKCGERFEVIQHFSDAPITVHEKCGGAVHRLISAPALQFKGSGWYVTDYAKSGSSSSSPEKSSDNGGLAKPETSAEKSSKSDTSAASSPASSSSSDSKPASSEKK